MKQEVYKVVENQFIIWDEELGIDCRGTLEKEITYAGEYGRQVGYSCNGQLHGPSRYFSKEDHLLSLTWFYEGKKIGKLHRYYANGKLYCIERYVCGVPHLGQEYFYPNGQIKTLLHYLKGKYHGKIQLFWPTGHLKRECIFTDGNRVSDAIYDQQGKQIHGKYSE